MLVDTAAESSVARRRRITIGPHPSARDASEQAGCHAAAARRAVEWASSGTLDSCKAVRMLAARAETPQPLAFPGRADKMPARSEERRVGKEGTGREGRWSLNENNRGQQS